MIAIGRHGRLQRCDDCQNSQTCDLRCRGALPPAGAAALLCRRRRLPRPTTSAAEEQAAFEAAVDRVAPAVVQIETVGGLEQVEGVLFGTGPTTGLVVDPERLHHFQRLQLRRQAGLDPRAAARRRAQAGQARGHRPLADARAAEDRRGASRCRSARSPPAARCASASGRSPWAGPSRATGPTWRWASSARSIAIWGKAIQTDAAVSPNNYGGPLVDIRGRVMGVLVPLSPEAADEIAGMEWYDSGIGFAIPMEHIQRVLPRLKKGEDLYPGLAGVSLKGPNLYHRRADHRRLPPEVSRRRGRHQARRPDRRDRRPPDHPRRRGQGGTRPPLRRRQDALTVLRGKERIESRGRAGGEARTVPTRLPRHPSDATPARGGRRGPLRVSRKPRGRGGHRRRRRARLAGRRADRGPDRTDGRRSAPEPGNEVEIEVRRADAVRKLKITLAALPEDLPPEELPPARASSCRAQPPSAAQATSAARRPPPSRPRLPPAGAMPLKIPEYANEVWAYVPGGYDPTCRTAWWSGCTPPAVSIGRSCWPGGSRFATGTI